uniref:Uncharacterized protein n=1 Tax=Arion vulgaris TaxID=1028688 RepID=A0A0B6ZYE5_9EUPU
MSNVARVMNNAIIKESLNARLTCDETCCIGCRKYATAIENKQTVDNVGMSSPSFNNNGNILNTEISRNQKQANGSDFTTRHAGMATRRMLFS